MYYIIFLISFCSVLSAQQLEPADFVESDVKLDSVIVWYSYVMDSTYLDVNTTDGDLPRRENRTYLYWREHPVSRKLMPVKKYEPE